jgi:LacI family transcriptional regulator
MTVRDVAREAKVSVASVSRVINGHPNVLPPTRQRILEVIERLNFVPHTGARSLSTRRTQAVGVVLPDLYGEFFSELIRGIDAAARARGLHLLLSSAHADLDEMAAAIRSMRGLVAGLLIMAPHLDTASFAASAGEALPMVFMNSRAGDRQPSVSIDSYGGARAMVRHLASRGHRRIVHIAGPEGNFDAHERLRAYRDELAASCPGVAPRVHQGDFSEASGFAAGAEIAAGKPRAHAVFAANDMMAIGCLAALAQAGLVVPRDVGVAGFDDIPMARYVRPALTTARAQIADLGAAALEELAARIDDPDGPEHASRSFVPVPVVRESCGTRKGGR